ncbi:MAG: hypothetical protein WBG92_22935 [Thiohalocapsa sp.]
MADGRRSSSASRVEIESNELFEGVDSAVLATLHALVETLKLPRKARVFNVGDAGEAIFFVLQGVVDLRLPRTQGCRLMIR